MEARCVVVGVVVVVVVVAPRSVHVQSALAVSFDRLASISRGHRPHDLVGLAILSII